MNNHFVMPSTIIPTLKRNSRDNERPLVEDIRIKSQGKTPARIFGPRLIRSLA